MSVSNLAPIYHFPSEDSMSLPINTHAARLTFAQLRKTAGWLKNTDSHSKMAAVVSVLAELRTAMEWSQAKDLLPTVQFEPNRTSSGNLTVGTKSINLSQHSDLLGCLTAYLITRGIQEGPLFNLKPGWIDSVELVVSGLINTVDEVF
jgi:hypothetical protein